MADGTLYTTFVDGSPELALPIVDTDEIAVVRAGVTYKIAPTTLVESVGIGPVVYISPLTGTTITSVAGQSAFQVVPAAMIAALTVRMPPDAIEGQVFAVSTTQDIEAVTVTAVLGDAIFGAQGTLGGLGAAGGFAFQYRLATNTWYRIR